ncbi:hypothetical protein PYCC9005_005171 [Savitreella phatthalungensis]
MSSSSSSRSAGPGNADGDAEAVKLGDSKRPCPSRRSAIATTSTTTDKDLAIPSGKTTRPVDRAPSTEGISPQDVAVSRFMTRHGPLEVANRLLGKLKVGVDETRTETTTGSHKRDTLIETVVWQSATGSEYELAKIPRSAAQDVKRSCSVRPPTTSELLWPEGEAGESEGESVSGADTTTAATANPVVGAFEDARVVVVPFPGGNPGGLNSGINATQQLFQNLMDAVQLGLSQVESIEYDMTSTKRKRRLKMNKHKQRVKRRREAALRKRLGK